MKNKKSIKNNIYLILLLCLYFFKFNNFQEVQTLLQRAKIQIVEFFEHSKNNIIAKTKVAQSKKKELPTFNASPDKQPYSAVKKNQILSSCKAKSKQIFKQKEIYQWKDSKGKMYLSDRFPKNKDYFDLVIHKSNPDSFFTLNLDSRYSRLPPFASDRMKRDVNQIYKIFIKKIGVSQLNPITLNLKLFDDKYQFIAYKEKVVPRMGAAGGFYISSLNVAAVHTGKNNQRMYDVTRHEATHAIINNAFGRIPTWLNEGLAEYFERLKFQNNRLRIVEPNKGHLHLLFNDNKLPNLNDYFNLSIRQWYAEPQKNKHYALGWSVVYFLMSSKNGKRFLGYMLDYLAYNYCQPFSDIDYINKHYSGGFTQFEKDWMKWLFHLEKRGHRY
jgi:hypothetical protein